MSVKPGEMSTQELRAAKAMEQAGLVKMSTLVAAASADEGVGTGVVATTVGLGDVVSDGVDTAVRELVWVVAGVVCAETELGVFTKSPTDEQNPSKLASSVYRAGEMVRS